MEFLRRKLGKTGESSVKQPYCPLCSIFAEYFVSYQMNGEIFQTDCYVLLTIMIT